MVEESRRSYEERVRREEDEIAAREQEVSFGCGSWSRNVGDPTVYDALNDGRSKRTCGRNHCPLYGKMAEQLTVGHVWHPFRFSGRMCCTARWRGWSKRSCRSSNNLRAPR